MSETKTEVQCKICKAPEAPHVIPYQRLGVQKTDLYCNNCWITERLSSMPVICPNLEEGEEIANHHCQLCETLGNGTLTVSSCCEAPEEWQDCELFYKDGESHADAECFITVCSKCGNVTWRDCLDIKK